MNVLTITQSHKTFILELNGQKLYVLNSKALQYQLKHVAKLDKTQVSSIIHQLEFSPVVTVDLSKAA